MQLREQAKLIKAALAQERVSADALSGLIKIEMDGNQELLSLVIDPQLMTPDNKPRLEIGIQEATNSAIKKSQQLMASKMQSMTGLNIPGL